MMKRSTLFAAALAAGFSLAAIAHTDDHAGHDAPAQPKQKEAVADVPAKKTPPDARAYFTDTEMVNQEGKKVRFYTDALEGKTVLINVIFTNCKDACPLITQRLNETRALLGERFGKEVYFVSISTDPVRDTPQALKKFAKKQKADVAGWTFLTGKKENVDYVLKRLGQFSDSVEDHSTLLIGGNVPDKRWTKIRPDTPPGAIAERLKQLAAAPMPLVPPAGN
jgi:protein SCO1/2